MAGEEIYVNHMYCEKTAKTLESVNNIFRVCQTEATGLV